MPRDGVYAEVQGRRLLERWLGRTGISRRKLAPLIGWQSSSVFRDVLLGHQRPGLPAALALEIVTKGAVPAKSWLLARERLLMSLQENKLRAAPFTFNVADEETGELIREFVTRLEQGLVNKDLDVRAPRDERLWDAIGNYEIARDLPGFEGSQWFYPYHQVLPHLEPRTREVGLTPPTWNPR